jgi:hypothetical protein
LSSTTIIKNAGIKEILAEIFTDIKAIAEQENQ